MVIRWLAVELDPGVACLCVCLFEGLRCFLRELTKLFHWYGRRGTKAEIYVGAGQLHFNSGSQREWSFQRDSPCS